MDKGIANLEARLKDHLELPRAILIQLRETRLFNSMIDQAIDDLDELLKKGSKK